MDLLRFFISAGYFYYKSFGCLIKSRIVFGKGMMVELYFLCFLRLCFLGSYQGGHKYSAAVASVKACCLWSSCSRIFVSSAPNH